MKQKDLKKLGYGVAIHFNDYRKIFEVYQLGTYHPSSPLMNEDAQIVSKHKSLKKAVKLFNKNKNN
jgi:hypothetical protein